MSTLALAFEEAGHALVSLAYGREIDTLAISPDGGLMKTSGPIAGDGSEEELRRSLVITFAGPIARAYAPPSPHPDALEKATSNGSTALVRGLLAASEHKPAEQPSDCEIIEHYRERLGDETIEQARLLAIELVDRLHAVGKLERLADELYWRGEIRGDDLGRILDAPAT